MFKTVMVNNSTNINKTKYHHSQQLIEHKKKKVLDWNRQKNVTNLYQASPLDNRISNGNTYINKRERKTCTYSLPLKKTTYYYKNEWPHKHGFSIFCTDFQQNVWMSVLRLRIYYVIWWKKSAVFVLH